MSTFMLIHGAWHGSWCWQKVIPLLEKKGHAVIAPDLPGHGSSDNPDSISLETYTRSVVDLIREQIESVILVGHSMSGIVISQAAEHVPGKIRRLVYLSAYLLQDGQTMFEVAKKDNEGLVFSNLEVSRNRKTARVKEAVLREAFYNDCSEEDFYFAMNKLVPQPLAPISTPIHITKERWGRVPRSYIECSMDQTITNSTQQEMHTNITCESVSRLESGHSPFLSVPEKLAEILGSEAD
ncbi:MAG: alpha/beta fold hydrolase [Gammaproteobacteria bacterium]|nr:alpha/beta fold hydrolase [Gammaproteobacteria bacterium]NIQ74064.1 alpha/beta fold hydrolase [Gammaproteobacteria bacterium]NIV26089.1 alpha/beta fold hydrolase [Gammaproteobacteria bacterium]NIW10744.1 alpha/beta fold hydrolase [Gammaproteobacteria bacterium]